MEAGTLAAKAIGIESSATVWGLSFEASNFEMISNVIAKYLKQFRW